MLLSELTTALLALDVGIGWRLADPEQAAIQGRGIYGRTTATGQPFSAMI
jgi:hypothetical protein